MSSRERWLIEGEWSGYTSGQRRVVHREVVSRVMAQSARKIGTIRYTDGTSLSLSIRPCKIRERVTQILGYRQLIRQCIDAGHGDVARLM